MINDSVGIPWSRTVYQSFDGAGRQVYTKDENATENAIALPSDQATSPVTFRYLGGSPASGTLLEKTETYLDGRFKARSETAVVPKYADYSASTSRLTAYSSPYSPASGGNAITVDSLGRTVATSVVTPSGSNFPQTGAAFQSTWTYDESGNLASRAVPGASTSYYEVFSTTTDASSRTEARSTDGAYEDHGSQSGA